MQKMSTERIKKYNADGFKVLKAYSFGDAHEELYRSTVLEMLDAVRDNPGARYREVVRLDDPDPEHRQTAMVVWLSPTDIPDADLTELIDIYFDYGRTNLPDDLLEEIVEECNRHIR